MFRFGSEFIVLIVVLGSAVGSLWAQSAQFEVAAIRRNTSGGAILNPRSQPGGRFTMQNAPVARLIRTAYPDVAAVIGAPDWVETERYDVTATAGREPSEREMLAMIRALLAERFRFVARTEQREQDVYALLVAGPGGSPRTTLQRSTLDCEDVVERRAGAAVTLPPRANGAPACGLMSDGRRLVSGGLTIAQLIRNISPLVDRPIVDRTALAGYYEFTLEYAARPGNAGGIPDAADERPSLFAALQEQLALRLEPRRAALDVLVIDRIDRPAAD